MYKRQVEEQVDVLGQRRGRTLADSGEQTPAVQVDVVPPGSIPDAGEQPVPQRSTGYDHTGARARVNTHRLIPDSGERTQVHNIESGKSPQACMSLKEHKKLKHGKDVPPEAQLQYLKPGIFAQALVHNKFVFTLPKDVRGDKADLQVLASHAYSSKKFWYVDCKILSPEVPEDEKIIQMPVVRGNTPTTNHKHNLRDLFNRIYQ